MTCQNKANWHVAGNIWYCPTLLAPCYSTFTATSRPQPESFLLKTTGCSSITHSASNSVIWSSFESWMLNYDKCNDICILKEVLLTWKRLLFLENTQNWLSNVLKSLYRHDNKSEGVSFYWQLNLVRLFSAKLQHHYCLEEGVRSLRTYHIILPYHNPNICRHLYLCYCSLITLHTLQTISFVPVVWDGCFTGPCKIDASPLLNSRTETNPVSETSYYIIQLLDSTQSVET